MLTASLIGWCEHLLASFGYIGVLLIMLTESVVMVVPSEVTLPLFGFTVGRGDLQIVPVILIAVLAGTVSTLPLFLIGRRLGLIRLRHYAARWGRPLSLTPAAIDRALGHFSRFGGWAVLLGRMLPGLRLVICLTAGVAGMPFARFFAWCMAGNVVWTLVFVSLGALLGENYRAIENVLNPAVRIVAVLAIALVLWRVLRQIRIYRRSAALGPHPFMNDHKETADADA